MNIIVNYIFIVEQTELIAYFEHYHLSQKADENRRILLDLESVLEGVQVEINKEENQKAILQRQYSNDKYAWELERKKLKWLVDQVRLSVK